MLKEKVLPADTFVVINKSILNDQDRRILTMLYQPIIGSSAIGLFFSLWSYLDKLEIMSLEYTHHNLMTSMKMRLESIIEAREKLEAIGLVRTYIKKDNINNLIYELYSPLTPYEFFNNPILSVSLYNNIGKVEFEKVKEYFKIPKINLKDYEEISCNFSDVFESTNINSFENMIDDIKKVNINKLSIISKIDLDNAVSLIPDEMFNIRSLTRETKDLIYKLSFIYNLDDEEVSELIRNSLNDKRTIDKKLLRDNARKYYQFEHSGKLPSIIYRNQPEYLRKVEGDTSNRAKMIYQFETTSPYDFLVNKHDGTKPTKNEYSILEYLLIDMNLKPGVVNVLLDYVLKINNNKLIKNFIEVIAEQWSRSKIETVEDAMALAEKEYKKSKKIKTKTKIVEEKPEWFNKEIKNEQASKEEVEEINKLLSQY
ncbi:MAG: DnaD domain protein [Bacilli bacterium]|nr:DnaD domain protein [Bacilli bacterium]MBP3445603.1 DnaD domain protein [Bacilli bacterium]